MPFPDVNPLTDRIQDTGADERIPADISHIAVWEETTPVVEDQNVLSTVDEVFEITSWDDRYALDVPVVLLPAYCVLNNVDHWTGYNAVVRPDNGSTYYIGRRYTPVQNKDIRIFLEEFVDTFDLNFVKGSYDHGTTCWEFIKPDVSIPLSVNGKDLSTSFRVVVTNSYDGSTSLWLRVGGLIHYCQNRFGLPKKKKNGGIGIEYKVRHTEKSSRIFDEVSNRIPKMIDIYTNTLEGKRWGVMPETVIHGKLEELFPRTSTGTVNTTMVALELARSRENWGSDDFNWFMALTNATTYPQNYGLTSTAVDKIVKFTDETFLV
jgi:hypothetical protein